VFGLSAGSRSAPHGRRCDGSLLSTSE
jgi:hypothetical protein